MGLGSKEGRVSGVLLKTQKAAGKRKKAAGGKWNYLKKQVNHKNLSSGVPPNHPSLGPASDKKRNGGGNEKTNASANKSKKGRHSLDGGKAQTD